MHTEKRAFQNNQNQGEKMYSTSDFKKGLNILLGDEPFTLTDFQHHKPGKGNAVTRAKLKNLLTGSNLEKTFKSNEKFGVPDIEYKDMSFLYQDESGLTFMDQTQYDQVSLNLNLVGDSINYLTENMEIKVCFFNERVVGLQLPKSVQLKVSATEPGFKGNTVSNTTKPATLQTGLVVQVPLHIKEGDLLKIHTDDGSYVERINS